jgi:hypothetical protein
MKCQNCGKNKKVSPWVGKGGMMDYVHGNFSFWCDRCQTKAQLKYVIESAVRIPSLIWKVLLTR